MQRWEQFNSIIEDENLNLKEKGLLLIIFRYVNYEKGYANPSRALIKKLFGTKKNDVLDKYLNLLIEKGYLCRIKKSGIRTKYIVKVGTQREPTLGTQIEPSSQIEPGSQKEPILGSQREPILGTLREPTLGSLREPQKENLKEKIKQNIKENIYIDFHIQFGGDLDMVNLVVLSNEQMSNLLEKFNKELVFRKIRELDEYLLNNPSKKFKNHYLTLYNWLDRDESKLESKKDIENKYR